VIVRDGYKCVLTGFRDPSHPELDESIPSAFLQASHILRRSIGNFNNDHTSDSVSRLSVQKYYISLTGRPLLYTQFKSAVTTFDILVNFTRIPVKKLEDLHSHIDDPSNGMMLEFNAHNGFDRFYWCLKKTEVGFMAFDCFHIADDASRQSMCTL